MQVAVRDLKANLSRLLARFQDGEVIEVTSHKRPVARIHGIPNGVPEGWRESIAAGVFSWRGGKPLLVTPVVQSAQGTLVSQLVREDRG